MGNRGDDDVRTFGSTRLDPRDETEIREFRLYLATRSQNKRLREALEKIARLPEEYLASDGVIVRRAQQIAHEALKGEAG